MELDEIKSAAFEARALYRIGAISRAEAAAKIQPYIKAFNDKAGEVAKKYNLRAKKITFAGFVR